MSSRHRGAALLLALLVVGRLLDAFDLPFESRALQTAAVESTAAPASGGMLAVEAAAPPAVTANDSGATALAPKRTGSAPVPVISINHASAAELQTLPGIGPVLAARIVAARGASGGMHSLSELRRVKGIGARTCARLAPCVRFD